MIHHTHSVQTSAESTVCILCKRTNGFSGDGRLAEPCPVTAPPTAKEVMEANWNENRRLRDIDKAVAVVLGWKNEFTVELVDWGDGTYGYDSQDQHRPLPRWSQGGRDTVQLIVNHRLMVVPPAWDYQKGSKLWQVGYQHGRNTFLRRKLILDPVEEHESLPEAVCAWIMNHYKGHAHV